MMIEPLLWCLIFVLCVVATQFQFQHCISVGLIFLKILNSVALFVSLRLFFLFRYEVVDYTLIKNDIFAAINSTVHYLQTID
jgi:hypothetical protein